jgi:signal transduction histidine kinase
MRRWRFLRPLFSSLAFQLRYGIAGLVGISVLVVAVVLIGLSAKVHFDETMVTQQARAEAVASNIEAYIYELQRKLGYLARVQGLTEMPIATQQALVEGLLRQNEAYEAVTIVDNRGQARLSRSAYGVELPAHAPAVKMAFSQSFSQGADFVGVVNLLPNVASAQGEVLPVILLAVPIRNQEDEIDGMLAACVNLRFLWSLIQQVQVGQTGYAYVLDNRNTVIAQPLGEQKSYYLQSIDKTVLAKILRDKSEPSLLVDKQDNSAVYRGLVGTFVFGAVSRVPGMNWVTVVEIPLAEVMGASYQLLMAMLVALGGAIAIASTTGFFFYRNLMQPLLHLTQAATVVSRGNLDVRVPISRYRELGLLGRSFNQMADQLKTVIHDLTEAQQSTQESLTQLKKAQTQLIQSEKLSSLGQMVAGIAHEVNNPLTFIHANLEHLHLYAQDLMGLVNLYQLDFYPNLSEDARCKIDQRLNEIDYEFLQEDFFKALKSMQVGTYRIQDIVVALRSFSRLDETSLKHADIHEGLESTLMILTSRLKATAKRPAIELVKSYSQLPNIACYPGQLNQVFFNILENAIDALDGSMASTSNGDGGYVRSQPINPNTSPTITLVTESNRETIKIVIANNGPSILPDAQQRIFDPFFTTKPVGQGTGLGMSISYQIVTETHQGSLECFSEPGQGVSFVITLPMSLLPSTNATSPVV